jgi:hypothetical protein
MRNLSRRSARHRRIPLQHRLLHVDGALHGLGDAAELNEQAIARGLDETAVMLGDLGIDQLAAERAELLKRSRFVGLHQPRIPNHIGGDDDHQPT